MVQNLRKNLLKVWMGFPILLIICNFHLFHGSSPSTLIYQGQMVAAGEWWRVITHLFVHVSWYHLFLDGTAVVLLWRELEMDSHITKVFTAALCASGSLAAAIVFSPYVEKLGYCGLSGMAHGLMLFVGLSWMGHAFSVRRQSGVTIGKLVAGCVFVLLSGGKAVLETMTGSVFFAQFHFGDLGFPIVHAHLGGVFGGLTAFFILKLLRR